jgi:NAD+ synthase
MPPTEAASSANHAASAGAFAIVVSELVIAIAQINPTVGDIDGNLELVRDTRARAAAAGADLVLFPELVICGYPPEDLVLKRALQDQCRRAVMALAEDTGDGGPALLVGTPWVDRGKLHNAVALLQDGKVETTRYKYDLPNYGVFDEKRVFATGPIPGPIPFRLADGSQARLGVMICEDMWTEDVAEGLDESGAEILLIPNGSPF